MIPERDSAIEPDIRKASTLPGRFYSDARAFEACRERIFARSWQILLDADRIKTPGKCAPVTMLEGFLGEPILFTRDAKDAVHCVSNVCTHRGNVVCESEGVEQSLRCRYHGRRFGLDGRFVSMPEFEGAEGFPTEKDSLVKVPFGAVGKFLFASIDPAMPFADVVGDMERRLAPVLRMDDLVLEPALCRDYLVRANWALYCDNYLEGFHIPYVHGGLAQALDYGSYRTETFRWSCLQVGVASRPEDAFRLPPGSPDAAQSVAGYYWFLFPNTMVNVYPWGVSINIVKPLAVDRTKIAYWTYVSDRSRLETGAGAGLDRVEREDEAIVESVQKGIASRLYDRGRFSPAREAGVHWFHRLIAESLTPRRGPTA